MSDGVEGIRNVIEVLGVETSDGDATIHSHVDSVLLAELVDLVGVEASVSEHADLVSNVGPVVLVATSCKCCNETVAHLLHAAGHIAEVLMPHGGELSVTEDGVDDTSAMNGRVGVDGPGNLLDAAHHDVLLGSAVGDNREGTGTLAVKAEVLSEGLEKHDVVGVLLEELEGVAVFLEVTRSEALVGRVESGEHLLSLDDLKDFLPLGISGVDTSRVVGTHVEHDDGVVLSSIEILLQAFEIKSLGLGVIVAVVLPVVTNEIGDGPVDGPGRVGDQEVDILVRVPLAEEGETKTERARA